MLQRAASNAYSWWCASHIRTNQSKWLNNDLQEMESRVQAMLKIIEEDADSFARRAEMYYRRRPELINFVEETYRAYRALADKFDHVSGELHKANNTLATAFPDVQFPMEDDDDDNSEAFSSSDSNSLKPPPRAPHNGFPKPPPEIPQISLPSKRRENKPSPEESLSQSQSQPKSESSQIGEDKAKETVGKLQKAILVMQTEKEFIKSSYEIGLAKYWEIEKMITEMQEEVCSLQDQFSATTVIEDDEARALMAATALKSCKDTLLNLQEHQKRSMEQTELESERIKTAKEKLRDLKGECGQADEIPISDENMGTGAPSTTTEEETSLLQQETLDLESIYEKIKGHCEITSQTSVIDLAEKIDELVNKLLNLEVTVSSHTAQLQTLRSETDHIQKHLRSLEENKLSFVNRQHSSSDSSKPDEELHEIQTSEKHLKSDKSMDRTDFTEPGQDFGGDISEKLQFPNQVKNTVSSPFQGDGSLLNMELKKTEEKHTMKIQDTNEEDTPRAETLDNHVQPEPVPQLGNDSGRVQPEESESEIKSEKTPQVKKDNHMSADIMTLHNDQDDETPNLLQLLSDGMEGKEKVLLAEYTTILRSYKETKRKLLEVEKQNQEKFGETMSQVRQLKNENAIKDGEIRSLRQILSSLQKSSESNLQNSEILEGLNLESTTIQHASSGVEDKGSYNSEEDAKPYRVEESQATLVMEEKFRKDIDALLDENLEFWLRFSTSFHQIQRFRSEFQSLQSNIEKLKDNKKREVSKSSAEQTGKSEPSPEDKKLRELKTELQVWVEQNAMLRRELEIRFSSLCDIQEEISGVSAASPDGGVQFTPYQAAKFQGEVLNMQQENNKVKDELQAGLDHVKSLQDEVEKTLSNLSKLHEKLELSSSKNSHHSRNTAKNFSNKNKGVPLRSFLYGGKPKKPSIFS